MRRTESRDSLLRGSVGRNRRAGKQLLAASCVPIRHIHPKGAAMAIAKQTTATVIPALQYQDAPAAIAFLCKAFGFEKMAVYEGEGGTIEHAQLTLGNGMVMLGSAKDTDYGKLLVRPRAAGGVTMSVYCIVGDPDAHFARAKAAGAEIMREPETQDYGGRDYTCRDPEGHVWTFGTYDPWAAY
jgi:uncharacterized glyoxalase superfamily protein PhnB